MTQILMSYIRYLLEIPLFLMANILHVKCCYTEIVVTTTYFIVIPFYTYHIIEQTKNIQACLYQLRKQNVSVKL